MTTAHLAQVLAITLVVCVQTGQPRGPRDEVVLRACREQGIAFVAGRVGADLLARGQEAGRRGVHRVVEGVDRAAPVPEAELVARAAWLPLA